MESMNLRNLRISNRVKQLATLPRRIADHKKYRFLLSAMLVIGFVFVGVRHVDALVWPFDAMIGAMQSIVYTAGIYIFSMILSVLLSIAELLIRSYLFLVTYSAYSSEPMVATGWSIIRDIVNALFVVLLLVVAVGTVLNLEAYGFKKLLPKVIIMVLLVNFSFFFSKEIVAVADAVTNIFKPDILSFGQTLFNFINPNEQLTKLVASGATLPDGVQILGAILKILVILTILVGWMIFNFILLDVIMTVRIVAIMVLIVLAPLAYIGMIIPGTAKFADKWWQQLLGFAFYGPIATFFIWLSMVMMKRSGGITQFTADNINVSDLKSLQYSSLSSGIFLRYLLIGILFSAALYAAKELSLFGVDAALGVAKQALGVAAGIGLAGAKAATTPIRRRLPSMAGFKDAFNKHEEDVQAERAARSSQMASRVGLGDKDAMQKLSDKRVKAEQEGMGNLTDEEVATRFHSAGKNTTQARAAAQELAKRGSVQQLFESAGGRTPVNRANLEGMLASAGIQGNDQTRLLNTISSGAAKEGDFRFSTPGQITRRMASADTKSIKGASFTTTEAGGSVPGGAQRTFTMENARYVADMNLANADVPPQQRRETTAQYNRRRMRAMFGREAIATLRDGNVSTERAARLADLRAAQAAAPRATSHVVGGQTFSNADIDNLQAIHDALA